ncbi:MAG: 50S ribosomal protein L22 [Pontiellaceae bacterium]
MEISATTKYIRMSPTKARDLASEIKGLSVEDALKITQFNARKAAVQIGRTLKSAIANAEHNNGITMDKLFIKNAIIDGGPTMKRFRPRARGSASPIQKKTSHITIILSDK